MKRYYSVKEASKLLGFSTNTIYKYLDEGKVQSKRLGKGRFKIPYSELEKYLTPEQTLPHLEDKAEVIEKITETYYEKEQTKYIEPSLGDSYFMTIFLGLTLFGGGLLKILLIPQTNIFSLVVTISVVVCGALMILRAAFYKAFLSVRQTIKYITFVVLIISCVELVFTRNYNNLVIAAAFLPILTHRILRVPLKRNPLSFYQEFLTFSVVTILLQALLFLFVPDASKEFAAGYSLSLSGEALARWWLLILVPPAFFVSLPLQINKRVSKVLFLLGGVFSFVSAIVLLSNSMWIHAYHALLYSYFAILMVWWTLKGVSIARLRLTDIAGIFTWMCLASVLGIWTIYSMNNYQFDLELGNSRQQIAKVIDTSNEYFSSVEENMLSVMTKSDLSTLMSNPSTSTEEYQFVAERIFNHIPKLQRVGILDKEGKLLAIYPRLDSQLGSDLSQREYFQKTKNNKRANVSTIFDSIAASTKAVGVTQPIFSNNQFLGVLYAGPNLFELSDNYQRLNNAEQVYAFDALGKYVLHPERSKIGDNVPELIKSYATQDVYKTDKSITVFDTAILSNWTFYIEKDLGEIKQRNKTAVFAVSTIMFVNALVSMAASIALARKVEKDD